MFILSFIYLETSNKFDFILIFAPSDGDDILVILAIKYVMSRKFLNNVFSFIY